MTKKILIIDGHPVYIHKLEGFLEGLTYGDITLAKTGKEGLEKLLSIGPDLVIMSVVLPDMDAYEVCRMIKEKRAASRIIVQTGLFVPENDIQRFKRQGADIILDRKEKNLKPLEEAIKTLIA